MWNAAAGSTLSIPLTMVLTVVLALVRLLSGQPGATGLDSRFPSAPSTSVDGSLEQASAPLTAPLMARFAPPVLSSAVAPSTWSDAGAPVEGAILPIEPVGAPREVRPSARPSPPSDPRRTYVRLLSAARAAASGTARDCYRTTVRTAVRNGATGDGLTWPENRSHRGQALAAGLRSGIADGTLKPGTVVYANRQPGTDPMSLDLANLPHWFTYLGKDSSGKDRFSDQYSSSWSLDGLVAEYGASRRIDAFLDPYRKS